MFLQTLFASCSLCYAITASAPLFTKILPVSVHRSVVMIHAGRSFPAEILSPRVRSRDVERFPGVIIIATDETRDRAFMIASRMAEIGITAMMYLQDESEPQSYQVHDAWAAVDSMRGRYDVRSEEIGVIAFEQATRVVPTLVRDTTLDFAIAASSMDPVREIVTRYTKSRAATLLVHGVKNRRDSAEVTQSLGLNGSQFRGESSSNHADLIPQTPGVVAPNVTVWPVPRDELKEIGEARSPLGLRVVNWVRDQVHANPTFTDQGGVLAH